MRVGLDFLAPLPIADVRSLGASFVGRYANLSAEEAQTYKTAGIELVSVFESNGYSFRGGLGAGELEAHTAASQAANAGMVGGHPIYFAPADTDISQTPDVTDDYFRGVNLVLPKSRIGVYGGYDHVKHVLDVGLAGWAWQTSAWSQNRWDERASLRQVSYHYGYDIDWAMEADFGQWIYGVPLAAPKPPLNPARWLLPAERACYNEYQDALKHPYWNRKKITMLFEELVAYREAIHRAADGNGPHGPTEPGWNIRSRQQRWDFLAKVTGLTGG